MRPLIGITTGSTFDDAYARAVEAAGGLPVVLPAQDPAGASDALARLDGLILGGGPDLDPRHFGEEPLPEMGRIDPERDAWDLALARVALAVDVPLLGICRGIQVLNVAAGGSLYQDVGRQVRGALKHTQDAPRWYPTHSVAVQPGAHLAATLAAPTGACPPHIRVNSFHHQAVWEVAPGFIVSARAPDGVAEGIERPGATFALGIQWHPEAMWERDARALALFRGLVDACRGRVGL